MEAHAIALSKIAKLQAQYLGEQVHWSATDQNLYNNSALTMEEMAPVVRFIERNMYFIWKTDFQMMKSYVIGVYLTTAA